MSRRLLYSALIVALAGTVAIWFLKQHSLILGWWLGTGIGLVNFSSLLSSLSQQTTTKAPAGKFQKTFMARYILLAAAFFLVIQLGRDQLGIAVLGFVSLYIAFFIDYFIRTRKRKISNP